MRAILLKVLVKNKTKKLSPFLPNVVIVVRGFPSSKIPFLLTILAALVVGARLLATRVALTSTHPTPVKLVTGSRLAITAKILSEQRS